MKKGTINCNRCGKPMPENGACPSCNTSNCHIEIYYHKKLWKFPRTKEQVLHGYNSAFADLIEINRQIKEKKFNPVEWTTGKIETLKVRNVLHKWLAEKEKEIPEGTMAPGLANYPSYTRRHYIPFFGDMVITDIDKQVLKDLYKELRKKGIKHKTQKNIMDGFHAFMEWAVDSEEDYIQAVPPFPTVKVTDATPQQAIDRDTQQAGILRIPERHRGIFIVMTDMCFRPGEVVVFKVLDYVPEFKGLWVQRTESRCRIKENTKANKKVCMKLTDDSLEVVEKQVKGRFNDKCLDQWLFINPDTGRRYTAEGVREIWKKYSGVKFKLYESSRHSTLTHLAETGDAYLIRDAGRHSDIRTSQKYVHNSQERLVRALNARKRSYTGRPRVEENVSEF